MINSLVVNRVGKKIIYIIQKKASQLDLKFFDTPQYYNKLENTRRIIGRRWDFLLRVPVEVVGEIITLFALITVLGTFNIVLIPIIIIGILPHIIIQLKVRKKEVKFYSDQIPETRKIYYTETILSTREFAKEVRLFGFSNFVLKLSQDLFNKQYEKIKKLKIGEFKLSSFSNVISAITMFGCQIYIAVSAFFRLISIGDWQLYTQTAQAIYGKLSIIFSYIAVAYEEDLYADILNDFLDIKPEIDLEKGIEYPFNKQVPYIKFENVKFKYPGAQMDVLKKVNFTIKPGEKVAIVGLNGAGKSTIIKLLTRLYEPDDGKIFYNNIEIKKIKPASLYKQFCVVFQDFARYAFTLKYNIGISRLDNISDIDSIKKAALLSGVDKIVTKLPDGYDTHRSKPQPNSRCEFDLEYYLTKEASSQKSGVRIQ